MHRSTVHDPGDHFLIWRHIEWYVNTMIPELEDIPMRRFHSYGPVNACNHLVNQCLNSLIGSDSDNESGHYFTIWAPRQTGKTWLTRQVVHEVDIRTDK